MNKEIILPNNKKFTISIYDIERFNNRLKLSPENKEKWVAAPESGQYKQTEGYLAFKDKGDFYYCCLGIYARIQGAKDCLRGSYGLNINDSDHQKYLPNKFEPALDYDGRFEGFNLNKMGSCETFKSLAEINDAGYDFPSIAAVIKELF